MKPSVSIVSLLRGGWNLLLLSLLPLLASGQTGTTTITGQVSNAGTGAFLEGATVELAGTNRTVTTDRQGLFSLTGVSAGEASLAVSYPGLDPQRITVAVGPAQAIVRQDVALTSAIYQLDKFTVAGEREGTAKAEVLQRQAPNVKAIISSDTFGNVADGNVGDLLQRMAGMTADYNGPDVRQVSIRGVGGDLNSVTMDGQQVASAQSAGTGRAFEFEQASLGNIETIEVTKAPTPDMPGASIGGSVNLVTKSAFDRTPGRIINYTMGFVTRTVKGPDAATWKQPIRGYGPSMNFLYSDVFGEKRNFGVTVTGTYHSQPPVNAITNQTFERKNEPGPVYTSSSGMSMGGATRTRLATGVKLDYKWSDRTVMTLNTSVNFFHENNYSPGITYATSGAATALATVDAAGNRTGGGYIHPDYANGVTRIFAHPTLTTASYSISSNDKSGRTILIAPTVRHRLADMEIDYGLSYSNSATWYDVSHDREKYNSRPKGTLTMNMVGLGWTVDRRNDPEFPIITQTEGPSVYDLNNFRALRIAQNDQRGYDTVLAGKFDLRKELRTAVPVSLKTGVLWQQQKRKLWNLSRRWDYAGNDGILGNADDTRDLAQFTQTPSVTRDIEAHYWPGRRFTWPDLYGVAHHKTDNPTLWDEDVAFTAQSRFGSLRLAKEKIAAAYVMGNVRFNHQVSMLTGVRFEDTRVTGEGPLIYISPEERARRAAWVGTVTDAEAVRRAESERGNRQTSSGSYGTVMPGVHLKYEPFRGFMARLSWSTGIGRPSFGSIIPNDTVDDTAMRVTRNNPELEPQYGRNWDLTAEYYFSSQGVVSIGAFRKKISDYIFTDNSFVIPAGTDNGFDGDYVGYTLTTQRNGGYAKIEGMEFSYQQQLSFLPGWAKGFGVSANYTVLRTEGNYGGATVLTTNSLAGFLPKSGTTGISYRGYGLDLRVLATYRGEYLTSNNVVPALVRYQVSKVTWNWRSRYAFRRDLSFFLDVDNIFAMPLDHQYRLYRDRFDNYRNFAPKIVAGITGQF